LCKTIKVLVVMCCKLCGMQQSAAKGHVNVSKAKRQLPSNLSDTFYSW